MRLLPIEAASVVEVTEQIARLESMQDSSLPKEPVGPTPSVKLWTKAYLAMRAKDFVTAAAAMRELRESNTPDVFDYLIGDPAIRIFLSDPLLQEFFPR
jgi:hypothetical protein